MTEKRFGNLAGGLLIGGLVGVIAGLVYAPRSGRETRDQITAKAKDAACRLQGEYETARGKGKAAYEKLPARLKDLEAKAESKAREVRGGSGAPA